MKKYTDFVTKSFGRIILVATHFGLSHVIFPEMTQGECERATSAIMDAQGDIDVLISLPLRNQNENERFKNVIGKLQQYFAGEHVEFTDISVDLGNCRPFQRDVLDITRQIPYGEVRTYKWIAEQLGKPKAARAVGQALGCNPVPIIIPCHRVIGSDGSLTGYGLGLSMKRQLLRMEKCTYFIKRRKGGTHKSIPPSG